MMSLTVASCLLAFAAPPVPQIVAGPVRVFVGIPNRDGFVDTSRGVGDSVKDVSRQVESIPGLVLSDDPGKSDLRLWLVERGGRRIG